MENKDVGYLTVAVTSAKGALPLQGARVRIFNGGNNDTPPLFSLVTDESGRTPTVELPAPPFEASQTPDSGTVPYASYTIDTELDGYYTVQNINAPVYPGVYSIQNVLMVPLGAAGRREPDVDVRFNESMGPDL